ncbi:arylalkylamine N-acetyltransferase-like 2 [Stomoxys calcitrans]|uniref:aralkylamine N-acetyltransferase n=1 Tax=Stomoxys calcitrans TaxID=35570 RepID=A0A1I8Q793_STOCA|nr:arylalkylamine N-acetyltransferase-like 2 [Stomoxys calcitrans]
MAPNHSHCLSEDDIEIKVITQADSKRTWDLMGAYFFPDEPLTYSSEPRDELLVGKEFLLSNIDHGTCLKAVLKGTDEIVGLSICGPKGPDEAEHMQKEADAAGNTKWGTILNFLAKVERDANVYERYNVTKVLHVITTCVDAKMRGNNIGARLYNAAREMAIVKGYELLTADCTSFYSARIKEQLGWELVNVIYYKDYLDSDNKQVFRPHRPHECCKTYAIRF